jgi:Peptidase family M28
MRLGRRGPRRWLPAAGGLLLCLTAVGLAVPPATLRAAGPEIVTDDLREWLGYIASDELQGRATFSTGQGLAAGYIEQHLREWGVTPGGDPGSFLQTVRVLGVKTTSRSSLTVRVQGETRTFQDGDGVTFPRNMGAPQTLTLDRVEFVGYGLDVPGAQHSDFAGKNVRGAAVVFLGTSTPRSVDATTYRRALGGRGRYATEQQHAAASLGPILRPRGPGDDAAASGASADRGRAAVDFTTAQRLDRPVPPSLSADDRVFEFLFSRAPLRYAELKRRASTGEPLPSFALDGVQLTIAVDVRYDVVRTQLTENVVGIVEGSDAGLKDTYVAVGAHYDHVGYAEVDSRDGRGQPGRVAPDAPTDRIWNGADDDGSGTVALMALARAFAKRLPRPKRSLLFVWHTGEERGLWGSRYFVDYPTVPIDAVVAQLNVDMIGRNRDNRPSEANTVYVVGSDRISTELHDLNRTANASLTEPLTLNYELNDPADPEQLYFRSDHYSYAARGVPVIFFTTGIHPDYHANTDEVSKIEFAKMTRIVQLIYETGARVANLDHAPRRDNLGPRAGKGTRE